MFESITNKMEIKIIHDEEEEFDINNSGFSLLIEFDNFIILFDAGKLKEAERINKLEKKIDLIVLSHGHSDHTEGLNYLNFDDIKTVISHPLTFEPKLLKGNNIGFRLDSDKSNQFNFVKTKNIKRITDNIFFLGEIPRNHEKSASIENDELLDDSGLVIKTKRGLVVIVGCGHSGLKNLTEYIRLNFKEPLYSIVGGFHLLDEKTNEYKINYLFSNYKKIYPMHCLNQNALEFFKEKGIDIKKKENSNIFFE